MSLRRDAWWPARCTLSGCTDPSARPHHHHMRGGHLSASACTCASVAEPGTRPLLLDEVHQ